jgi:hypothetical protein
VLRAVGRLAPGGAPGVELLGVPLVLGSVVATLLWSDVARTDARMGFGAGRAPLLGYLLVRPADCRGHLDVLRLLERRRLGQRIERAGVMILGDETEARGARRAVRREYPGVRTAVLTRSQRHWLASQGWDGRPALLVVQRGTGAPRLFTRVPLTTGERLDLVRLLEHLADFTGGSR